MDWGSNQTKGVLSAPYRGARAVMTHVKLKGQEDREWKKELKKKTRRVPVANPGWGGRNSYCLYLIEGWWWPMYMIERITGLDHHVIRDRIRHGHMDWSSLMLPAGEGSKRHGSRWKIEGKEYTVKEIAERLGISNHSVYYRLERGQRTWAELSTVHTHSPEAKEKFKRRLRNHHLIQKDKAIARKKQREGHAKL